MNGIGGGAIFDVEVRGRPQTIASLKEIERVGLSLSKTLDGLSQKLTNVMGSANSQGKRDSRIYNATNLTSEQRAINSFNGINTPTNQLRQQGIDLSRGILRADVNGRREERRQLLAEKTQNSIDIRQRSLNDKILKEDERRAVNSQRELNNLREKEISLRKSLINKRIEDIRNTGRDVAFDDIRRNSDRIKQRNLSNLNNINGGGGGGRRSGGSFGDDNFRNSAMEAFGSLYLFKRVGSAAVRPYMMAADYESGMVDVAKNISSDFYEKKYGKNSAKSILQYARSSEFTNEMVVPIVKKYGTDYSKVQKALLALSKGGIEQNKLAFNADLVFRNASLAEVPVETAVNFLTYTRKILEPTIRKQYAGKNVDIDKIMSEYFSRIAFEARAAPGSETQLVEAVNRAAQREGGDLTPEETIILASKVLAISGNKGKVGGNAISRAKTSASNLLNPISNGNLKKYHSGLLIQSKLPDDEVHSIIQNIGKIKDKKLMYNLATGQLGEDVFGGMTGEYAATAYSLDMAKKSAIATNAATFGRTGVEKDMTRSLVMSEEARRRLTEEQIYKAYKKDNTGTFTPERLDKWLTKIGYINKNKAITTLGSNRGLTENIYQEALRFVPTKEQAEAELRAKLDSMEIQINSLREVTKTRTSQAFMNAFTSSGGAGVLNNWTNTIDTVGKFLSDHPAIISLGTAVAVGLTGMIASKAMKQVFNYASDGMFSNVSKSVKSSKYLRKARMDLNRNFNLLKNKKDKFSYEDADGNFTLPNENGNIRKSRSRLTGRQKFGVGGAIAASLAGLGYLAMNNDGFASSIGRAAASTMNPLGMAGQILTYAGVRSAGLGLLAGNAIYSAFPTREDGTKNSLAPYISGVGGIGVTALIASSGFRTMLKQLIVPAVVAVSSPMVLGSIAALAVAGVAAAGAYKMIQSNTKGIRQTEEFNPYNPKARTSSRWDPSRHFIGNIDPNIVNKYFIGNLDPNIVNKSIEETKRENYYNGPQKVFHGGQSLTEFKQFKDPYKQALNGMLGITDDSQKSNQSTSFQHEDPRLTFGKTPYSPANQEVLSNFVNNLEQSKKQQYGQTPTGQPIIINSSVTVVDKTSRGINVPENYSDVTYPQM